MMFLYSLSRLTVENIEILGSEIPALIWDYIERIMFESAIAVPVRPTPALQWTTTFSSDLDVNSSSFILSSKSLKS